MGWMFSVCLVLTAQEPASADEQVHAIIAKMGGWLAASKPQKIALLTDSERLILIRYNRGKLEELLRPGGNPLDARVQVPHYRKELLSLGDPQILAETVKTVSESDIDSSQYRDGCGDLEYAMRPETLVMLAPAMLVDEPFVIRPMLGDVGSVAPKSYGLASLMLEIVAKSPAFTPEVRKWADDNRKVAIYKTMPMIRSWWKENEQAVKAKDYRAVRPGIDMRAADLAAKNEIWRQQDAFKDNLIAKGKDPADLENWNEWREVILPRLREAEKNQTFATLPPSVAPVLQRQPQTPASPSNPALDQSSEPISEPEARLLPLIVGAAALVGVFLFLWKRR